MLVATKPRLRRVDWSRGMNGIMVFGYSVYENTFTNPNPNETYWYLTTDFCYVREVDFWESLFDQYRFPNCALFEGGGGGGESNGDDTT
ncbi:hypothetical protein EYC84_004075 [Monilinia fructicola]|uniref:Uncharacterized protein n=1 Tax=Monilinia fructicola TaxID=38448 RepID=A0A5M9K1P1_MONFR|nr:hypothetical protein EYC84_004075 [Monilinia fructicola]